MDAKRGSWGGVRPGAGRKPAPVVRASIALPREVWAALVAAAEAEGVKPEDLAARWLAEYASAPLFSR